MSEAAIREKAAFTRLVSLPCCYLYSPVYSLLAVQDRQREGLWEEKGDLGYRI
jgi:hypothetical protein